jgi:hypothetical protein
MTNYQTRGKGQTVWTTHNESQIRDVMERQGFRHSELMAHLADLDAGHVLTAENGREFRKDLHHVLTAQDNETTTCLVTYRNREGELWTERVSVHLADVLSQSGRLLDIRRHVPGGIPGLEDTRS